ncbi:collagen binding domain-containing protein [Streptomyces sp. NPDC021100]|uniref:collagen binding domain-containing protein n=1 Tax=Streptomyces sp. NPDC021100 TaxID=3365114 RepID=UPI0037A104F2
MSLASPAGTSQSGSGQWFRRPAVAVAAMAVGTGIMLAPAAHAADKWGPGYLIPDTDGHAAMSHIGAYGPPGKTLPGVEGLAYCADPTLAGPEASGGYGPVRESGVWTSKTTGKQASTENIARAAYVVSRYGQTGEDAQAAAVDAALYSLLDADSAYALPDGKRAVQRLTAPGVAPAAKTKALAYIDESKRLAGPYKVNIRPSETSAKPGTEIGLTVDVTAASGAKVPGIKLALTTAGPSTTTTEVTTGANGTATTTLAAPKDGTATIKAKTASLPGTALRVVAPHNAKAQRMLIAGGHSSAEGQTSVKVEKPSGNIKVSKTAEDTGKALSGVAFEVKDASGKAVATGTTDADGRWQATALPSGRYTIHEVKAVNGYQLAADQAVTVTDGKTAEVTVTDAKIPQRPAPKPTPVPITELPKTGA